MTATAVALLVDDDEHFPDVQYDACMAKLLPDDFVMPEVEYTNSVTVDDVLGHRTGMPGHDDSYMGQRALEPDDARTITRNLRNLPVAAPLRSKYMYCNMMYTVASYLVEVKSAVSFSEFLRDRIFQPLGMDASASQPGGLVSRGFGSDDPCLATGYKWNKSRQEHLALPAQSCPEGQGAGSVMSSANDMIKWVKALMNRDDGPINERVYKGLTRLRSFKDPDGRNLKPFTSPPFYAAGLEVYYYRGYAVVWHNGSVDGFESRFLFLPDVRFGLVILGNSNEAGSVGAMLSRDLIDAAVGLPVDGLGPTAKSKSKKQPRRPEKEGMEHKKHAYSPHKDDASSLTAPRPTTGVHRGATVSTAQASSEATFSRHDATLHKYTGSYWHPGYHGMQLEVRDGALFIDATDRSFGFTLRFEYLEKKDGFTAHLTDHHGQPDGTIKVRFDYDADDDDSVVGMGLDLEPAINDLVWFTKVVVGESG
ncbi:hypothetical protein N3K66_005952 [Trichothecium roseum]|uniref:Uncharacterized protein n=1 Tax=Trichothecium roseum TaxID=47278 RepID=A0ACC0UZL3_9HYPO|nr:hypothetical protein N3K66_005952 [Trichothecium roseum]